MKSANAKSQKAVLILGYLRLAVSVLFLLVSSCG